MCLYCPTFAKLPDSLRVPVQVGDFPPPETNHHPNATIGKSKKIKYTKSNVDKQARKEKECNKPTLNLVSLMALSVALVTFLIVMKTMLLRMKCFSLVNFVCSTASFATLTIFVLLAVLGWKRLHKFAVGHIQHINLHCEVLNGLLEMLLFPGVIVLKLLIHLLEPFYKVLFNFETQHNCILYYS